MALESITWYTTWILRTSKDHLKKTSMNSITTIIFHDLFYNQRTIKVVVEKCIKYITPILSYIDITHLSDKFVTWTSKIDINSFKSVRNKRKLKITRLKKRRLISRIPHRTCSSHQNNQLY